MIVSDNLTHDSTDSCSCSARAPMYRPVAEQMQQHVCLSAAAARVDGRWLSVWQQLYTANCQGHKVSPCYLVTCFFTARSVQDNLFFFLFLEIMQENRKGLFSENAMQKRSLDRIHKIFLCIFYYSKTHSEFRPGPD